MPVEINETHDPNLKSWVESANDPACDFPIQNLPLVFFEYEAKAVDDEAEEDKRGWDQLRNGGLWVRHIAPSRPPDESLSEVERDWGVVIGDQILDFGACLSHGLYEAAPVLEEFVNAISRGESWGMAIRAMARVKRRIAVGLLRHDNKRIARSKALQQEILRPLSSVRIVEPLWGIQNYTDFYASIHHAERVGSMFRPESPLLPNYKWVPIGYQGRASSIVLSGEEVRRPRGQIKPDSAAEPAFAPSRMLDYELEVGVVIGVANDLGHPIPIDEAEDHIVGLCLVNDWSARDIQKWEYQPLGPFLAKNFATTISPFIVTLDALAPFRCPAYRRPDGDPRPLPYLRSDRNEQSGGFDITLEVHLSSKQMRDRGLSPVRLSRGSFKDMYWTVAQLIAHHTSNGCNLMFGDLLASGTVSGPTPESAGCLLELTWAGPGKPRRPIELPTGEKRLFLEDGDEVILKGYCERDGFRRIGFGECRGTVSPTPD